MAVGIGDGSEADSLVVGVAAVPDSESQGHSARLGGTAGEVDRVARLEALVDGHMDGLAGLAGGGWGAIGGEEIHTSGAAGGVRPRLSGGGIRKRQLGPNLLPRIVCDRGR